MFKFSQRSSDKILKRVVDQMQKEIRQHHKARRELKTSQKVCIVTLGSPVGRTPCRIFNFRLR
jgi:hypothetical protein